MKIACYHLNQLGDLLFSLPALKCLRDGFLGASITSIVRPGMAEILKATGLVDEVLFRNSKLNIDKLALVRQLRERQFDLAVVFSQSTECAVLAFLSGAPKRVGFINTSLGALLTRKIEFNHPPSTENNLRLISEFGCEVTKRDYSNLMKITPEQRERADRLLLGRGMDPEKPLASLAPGTSGRRSVKEWTAEGFSDVARYLIERGIQPVILGTQPAPEIVSGCPGLIDLSGATNLGEAAAILAKSGILIAVDSGILHLGAGVGTHVVGLYGPSNPAVTGPQGDGHVVLTAGEDCSPCIKTECSFNRKCMTNIGSARVIAAVDEVLRV